jgi:hypothetical protein
LFYWFQTENRVSLRILFSGELGKRMPFVASNVEVGLGLCLSLQGEPQNLEGDDFGCFEAFAKNSLSIMWLAYPTFMINILLAIMMDTHQSS